MSDVYDIKEHVIDCQHIREYPRATASSQEDVLKLAIKQYIPKDNPSPQPGDITIIGAHANGFPKELYEPLWDDLHAALAGRSVRIRGIWIADVANQGMSGILNEYALGNDPAWIDHSRDLLHMVNVFRAQMPRPLVGLAHSFGGNILVNLSLMHPRLLSSLVLIDPVISRFASTPGTTKGYGPAAQSTFRRDVWPDRVSAESAFRSGRFMAAWDARVRELWLHHGLRDTPTALLPHPAASRVNAVTLATTKHQEVFTFLRPVYGAYDEAGRRLPDPRRYVPDSDGPLPPTLPAFPFYRPEGPSTTARLPNLRPSVLYVFGGDSHLSAPALRQQKMEKTGTGWGGSGGAAEGRVGEVVLGGIGHLVCMEKPAVCAEHAAAWIAHEIGVWREEQAEYNAWASKSLAEKTTVDERWKDLIGRPTARKKQEGKAKI